MRQKIRRTIVILSLMLFPVTMNYLSPYLPIDAAMNGIIAGSLITFACLFISAMVTGRAWCGWVCPIAGLSDICRSIDKKPVHAVKLKKIRYTVFIVWAALVSLFFILAGGIKGINPYYFTESGVSVDTPAKFIIYYGILAVFLIVTLKAGKRGACHSICWMSPFLVAGMKLGRALKLPQIRIKAQRTMCTGCRKCDQTCPMSITVCEQASAGAVLSTDCILCGECVDTCPKKALSFSFNGIPTQPNQKQAKSALDV